MTKTAVLVSGGGATLQALLDLCYFEELPGLRLAAVISSAPGVYALERAENAHVPAYVVDRMLFPNNASFNNALLGMLRDMDIELVVCAGFTEKLGYALLHACRGRVIGVQPALFPMFCAERFDAAAAIDETLRRGLRVTGATAYFFGEEDTGFGPVISQRAVEVLPGDTAATLSDRVMRQGEWPALAEAVGLYCAGRLRLNGERVEIAPAGDE